METIKSKSGKEREREGEKEREGGKERARGGRAEGEGERERERERERGAMRRGAYKLIPFFALVKMWRKALHRAWTSTSAAAAGGTGLLDAAATGNVLVRASASALADVRAPRALHAEEGFVSEEEEARLVAEADRRLRALPYEDGHFDDVIHHFRELLGFRHIAPENAAVLARAEARTRALCGDDPDFVFLPVHILDLHPTGYILPHLDNYCGRTVAGVSLLSETVMRLTRRDRPDAVVELHLPRRSYYCLQYVSRTQMHTRARARARARARVGQGRGRGRAQTRARARARARARTRARAAVGRGGGRRRGPVGRRRGACG